MTQEIPLGVAQIIAFGAGVLIPFVVAYVTKYHAPAWVKSAVALAAAGATAVGLYLADTDGAHTWKGLVTSLITALIAAASTRVTVTGGLDTALARQTPNFGIGAPPLPPESAAVIKSAGTRKP